jgi:hypothetical protein
MQIIMLKRLGEERNEELPALDWFIIKPGLSMAVF